MASTSSSSIQKSFKYDVFLSFRGEDTRKSFVDHLYHALIHRSIRVYKDDEEIKKGKMISDEIIRSIKDSKFYIIVLSKNYASSSWCLNELLEIMECQKTNGRTAYPVFYDVEPTEVRYQSGVVGEAFAKHVNEEAAGRWRDALKEVADMAGWELKNTFDGHEAKFIQKITKEISLQLRFINSSVDGKLIGIKGMGGAGKTTLARAIFDQISFQFEGSSFVENVREKSKNMMCGLTSLQKQVLLDVLNIQDITVNGVFEGKKLMKQRMCHIKVLLVLDDVDHIDQLEALAGELSWFKLGSRVIITTREEQVLIAHGVPVNMILGVNLLTNMEANCLFNRYAFGRDDPNQDFDELSSQVVRYASGLPLTIKVLGSFLRGKDEPEWIDAVERLKTIPLKETLEILELSYQGLEEDCKEIFLDVACILKDWEKERAIRALESQDLHARSGLKVLEQKSLLTISANGCLGMHDHIVEMGNNIVRRLYPNVPYRHSRLWIKEDVEDILIEDKGTDGIRCIKVGLTDPVIVMKALRKMKELRFLEVNGTSTSYFSRGFDYDNIDEDSLHLPNSLRYLYWEGYPFTCLPKEFLANNLGYLEIRYSNIGQLWKGEEKKILKKLRFLDLSNCNLRTLDIGLTKNLERLRLEQCSNLVNLHMPIESFKLKIISIRHCKLIRTLDLKRAQNLDTLKVEGCDNLVELHMPIKNPKLKHLSLRLCMLKNLKLTQTQNLEMLDLICEQLIELHMPDESPKLKHLSVKCFMLKTLDLRQTQNLETLGLAKCMDLVELHMAVENLKPGSIHFYCCPKLRILDHRLFKNLDKLDVKEHEGLVELHLAGIKIKELRLTECSTLKTIDITRTQNLEKLHLANCRDLVELHIPIESLELKNIHIDSSKLSTLNLTRAHNLQNLHIEHCEDLIELHMPLRSPQLNLIRIRGSKLKYLNLGLSPHLTFLDVNDCFNLVEIYAPVGCLRGSVRFKTCMINQGFPMDGFLAELHLNARPLGICPLHPDNNLPKFHFECIYKELQLSCTQTLAKLFTFGNCACTDLASSLRVIYGLQVRKLTFEGCIPEVPKALDQLQRLEQLSLVSTNIEHFPHSILNLKHLKYLEFKSCWFLKQLPEDIDRLKCLEKLLLTDCISLRDIPNNICEMKHLKCLHLTNCILVEKLPKEMGRLKCLKELNIRGTGITDFPPSIFELEDLIFVLDGA